MNDIPRGTSRITLINYLMRSPHGQHQAPSGAKPDVLCGVTMADSQLDDELSVARIEFSDTPRWLQDLNNDPNGFPKKTTLGTIWRGINTGTGEPDENGRTEFIRAAIRGDLLYAEMLAEFADTDVNVQDKQGRTALHWASAGGHASLVQLCLSVTACDVGLRDEDSVTAFDIARLDHHQSEVIPNLFYRSMMELEETDPQEALLRALTVTAEPVSNLDRPKFPGEAIFDPVHAQNLRLVSALVDRGIDLTARDADGNTALHVAVGIGNTDIAVRLLQGGSDIDALDSGGVSTLDHANVVGPRMVQVLLDWKAQTAAGSDTEESVSDWITENEKLDGSRVVRGGVGTSDGVESNRPVSAPAQPDHRAGDSLKPRKRTVSQKKES